MSWLEVETFAAERGLVLPPELTEPPVWTKLDNEEKYSRKILKQAEARKNFVSAGYLGEETATALVRAWSGSEPPVRTLSDLFRLSVDKLASSKSCPVDRQTRLPLVEPGDEPVRAFSNKAGEPNISAYGLVFKLEIAKESELWRLLTALSIRLIGPEVAKPLSERFDSLEAVFQAETSEIALIQGVGEAAARSIRDWFAAPENSAIISSWSESGVRPRVEKITVVEREGLAGKNVLVTGSLANFDRDQIKSALVRAGARVA
jgi:DNA ligase (NAD+)